MYTNGKLRKSSLSRRMLGKTKPGQQFTVNNKPYNLVARSKDRSTHVLHAYSTGYCAQHHKHSSSEGRVTVQECSFLDSRHCLKCSTQPLQPPTTQTKTKSHLLIPPAWPTLQQGLSSPPSTITICMASTHPGQHQLPSKWGWLSAFPLCYSSPLSPQEPNRPFKT